MCSAMEVIRSAKQTATNASTVITTVIQQRDPHRSNNPQARVKMVAIGGATISITLISIRFTLSDGTQSKLGCLSGKCHNNDSRL